MIILPHGFRNCDLHLTATSSTMLVEYVPSYIFTFAVFDPASSLPTNKPSPVAPQVNGQVKIVMIISSNSHFLVNLFDAKICVCLVILKVESKVSTYQQNKLFDDEPVMTTENIVLDMILEIRQSDIGR